ncbi:MAG: hypothetical protein AAB434_00905 [Planctomycetota bacterium]
MTTSDLVQALFAVCILSPLGILAWNVQRMRGEVRKVVLVAEDLVALLEEGDFARALSRLDEIGGSLGSDVQEFLRRLLQQPWVGAGDAVRIAADHVVPRATGLLGFIACIAVPAGLVMPMATHHRAIEQAGLAIALFGVISIAGVFLLPFYADASKRRIIRAIHEVQHAAEKWLSEHREPR